MHEKEELRNAFQQLFVNKVSLDNTQSKQSSDRPKYNEKVQLFTRFIINLSTISVTDFSKSAKKEEALDGLREIYEGGFRHSYSEIFSCMIEFDDGIKEGSRLYNLNTNIKALYDYIDNLELTDPRDEELKRNIFKLYDHIALEFSRIAYWVSNKKSIERELFITKRRIETTRKLSLKIVRDVSSAKENTEKLQNIQDSINENVESAKKEAENLKSSQVTILGIFISIVVGLLGQIYVVGKGLSREITSESLGLLLILIIVASVCTITAVVALLHIIARLIGRDILSKCSKSESCDTCNQCFCIVGRIRYRLPYLYGFYQVAIILLLLSVGIFYILK